MATTKKAKANENKAGRVELMIPLEGPNADPNFLISVNRKNYVIPKGVTVLVPPEVKEEYDRHVEARSKFYAAMAARSEASKFAP